jgi:hypothetical protein
MLGDDLGVGVGVERCGEGFVEPGEVVQRGAQESEQASSLLTHRGLDERRLVRLLAAQVRQDRRGGDVEVALAPGSTQRSPYSGHGQRGRGGRGWGEQQYLDRGGKGQIGKRGQCRRVVLAEQRTDLVGDLLAIPDGVLVGASKDPHSFGEFGVGGQRSVRVGVGAQDVCQHERIAGVGLGPADRVAVTVAGHGQRVDRIERVADAEQRGGE